MAEKKARINKLYLVIILIMAIILVLKHESFAEAREYIKIIQDRTGITDITQKIDLDIEKDGEIYEYVSGVEEKVKSETKIQKHTSEQKEVDSDSKEYLEQCFDQVIEYEDEKYKGKLQLMDYNIQTISNGYSERIDSKKIILSNMPTNDLAQVEKTRIIEGKEYVLINVNWESEENQEIDNTLVPKIYKGTALYQCIVKIKNPNTYKVSANYMGEIEAKEQLSNYIITYRLKEQNQNFITPIVMIAGGIIILGLLGFLLKPNATVYNVKDNRLVKIKKVKVGKNVTIDITNQVNKIVGNDFVLQINKSAIDKLLNTTVIIQLNYQKEEVIITSQNNYFKF